MPLKLALAFLFSLPLVAQYSPPSGVGGTCAGLGGDVTGTCAANVVGQIEGGAIPTSAGALGTNASGQLISVAPGGGTTPGYPANQPVSGCGVEYVSGLIFSVGACTYTIGGTQYSSVTTTVTLSAADPSNPRIDVIYVDNTGVANKLTGTPAASPAQPTVDYSTQLPLNLVLVAANGTTPSVITTTAIYDENTEWTSTCSANLNCASTSNPYRGTKDIEATTAVLGNSFTLVKPAAGTTDLSTQSALIFYIRSKGAWPSANNAGANGLRTLSLFWLNGSTQVGVQVVLKDGSFGFSSSNTTTYQQISIPTSAFGAGSSLVTTLKAQVTGNGGTSSFGWYIDAVSLQGGQTAVTVSSNSLIRTFGAAFTNSGNALASGATTYFTIPYACTIAAWNITISPADTATIDIWKIATGTALPTISNTITASATPAISTGTAVHSTTLTGWSTGINVSANDVFGINLKAVGGAATQATLNVQCNAS